MAVRQAAHGTVHGHNVRARFGNTLWPRGTVSNKVDCGAGFVGELPDPGAAQTIHRQVASHPIDIGLRVLHGLGCVHFSQTQPGVV